MPKKLSPEEAQRIVNKFCKPPYDPDEVKLKEAMWVMLKEGGGEAFEWEEPEEEEEVSKKTPGAGQTASSAGGGALEGAGQYVGQIVTNVQGLGAAGVIAMSSATYFQAETVVSSTEEFTEIVREVEIEYGQTFG